jgi:GNAT superfamily N-acetyltransferase
MEMPHRIVTLSDQPELAELVASWILTEFGHPGSPSLEVMTALYLAPHDGPEETFVLFEGDTPVGTASLSRTDLPSRPDLTPWLASVYVDPEFRGRGYASTLVRQVEDLARTASVATLWLFTWTAEPLYARLGWERVGIERHRDQDVVLMMRDLTA